MAGLAAWQMKMAHGKLRVCVCVSHCAAYMPSDPHPCTQTWVQEAISLAETTKTQKSCDCGN